MSNHHRTREAVSHLCRLIATPSPSREETRTADLWFKWLKEQGATEAERQYNNVFAVAPGYDPRRPTLMLNSHHDTVRPVASWTRDPYLPEIVRDGEDRRLYGLGSNDAGASGVALASAYLDFRERTDLPYNLILAITAAEEVMGEQGMRAFLPFLKARGQKPDMVIVGEPTSMQPAIAERGLLVLDCVAEGKSGHAARGEGINALYRAMEDIELLRDFNPARVSEVLGPIRVNVTMISCGTQHNVVPDKCTFVADVRTTDAYTNEETVELLRQCVRWSSVTPRSTRVHASVIAGDHPLVRSAVACGGVPFVSPTTSDMALMHGIPSLKTGPGDSSRSHTADEYITVGEIDRGIRYYEELLEQLTYEKAIVEQGFSTR